ncbi:MAG: TetR/AcrR family transcriptional regulator [Anaerolineales bacterium]
MDSVETKLDPRVIRTRRLLRESFMELVAENGYWDITIQDITDRATLNRVTFYLHYDNKEDLLVQTTNHILDELVKRVETPKEGASPREMVQAALEANFQVYANYADFMKAMLGKDGVWSFIFAMQDYHFRASMESFQMMGKDFDPKKEQEIQIFLRGMHSTFMGVLQWWLTNDMSLPREEMAQIVYKIYTQGIYRCLGYKITEDGEFVDE